MLDDSLREFISNHLEDDTHRLLLLSGKYPGVDVKLAVTIIEARRRLVLKVPEWALRDDLLFTGSLAVEQCSSSLTAVYKQQFSSGGYIADITGGLGVDSYFFSMTNKKVFYCEQDLSLYNAATYNFETLGCNNIITNRLVIEQGNLREYLSRISQIDNIEEFDLIYADPSRRDKVGKRVFSLNDYKPAMVGLFDIMFQFTPKILLKISPMADLKTVVKECRYITRIDVVSVNNECKELLLLLERGVVREYSSVEIRAVNLSQQKNDQPVIFTPASENNSPVSYSDPYTGCYLYQPNSSLLKAGAFKTVANRFNLDKIAANTHLYLSGELCKKFPGRVFKIKEVKDFNKANLRNLSKTYPKANISVRNLPLSASDLKSRLKIGDGGDTTIFGCTISNGNKRLIVCEYAG